jgi:purine-binding chemotaxis protein CheW
MIMSFYDHFDENEQAVLRRRAERAADKNLETPKTLASIDTLVVTLGNETYGLPLQALTAAYQVNVNLTTPIVPVPCTPPFVAGIANIRGHVVPVVDLAVLLGVPDSTSLDSTGIVVVANEDVTMAFRVDAIGDAILVQAGDVSPVSGLFDLAKTEYLQGTLPDGTILLDMEAILSDHMLIVDETVS